MRKEERIARDILSTIGFCSSRSPMSPDALEYLATNPTRIELCVYAAELLIPPQNINELSIVSGAYYWAGAKYRKEAIKWLTEYIEHGATCDDVSSCILTTSSGCKYDQKKMAKALTYTSLASSLAREYRFDEAIDILKLALKIEPLCMGPYATIPSYYIKKGDYKSAFDFLRKKKWCLTYFRDKQIRKCIKTAYKNTKEKYKRGYVYKPRK